MFGYKDDDVFLLSIEEYFKYKPIMEKYCTMVYSPWMLRDCSDEDCVVISPRTAYGERDIMPKYVHFPIRPGVKLPHNCQTPVGGHILARFYTGHWCEIIKIDSDDEYDLFIADVPISWECFGAGCADYEHSSIRSLLVDGILDKTSY